MARMMDDSSRAQMLMQMLSQQQGPRPSMGGGPAPGAPTMGGQQVPEEEITNPKGPPPSNGVGVADAGSEPMVQVPVSLANAGMQALMSQASGGRSLGADGAGEDGEEPEPGDAEYDSDDKPPMKRRSA